MKLEYATKENIIRPKVKGVIGYVENDNDYIYGASPIGAGRKILQPNSSWLSVAQRLKEYEQQKFKTGEDSYWCTNFSDENIDKLETLRKYGFEIDEDARYISVGDGSIPYAGNSITAAPEFKRKHGIIKERKNVCDMTWTEGWTPITVEEYAEGEKNLESFLFTYELLKRAWNGVSRLPYSTDETLLEALQFGPLKVVVDGSYEMDEEGRIGKILDYTHCVVLLGPHYENNVRVWWDVLDSESKQLLKFVPDYKFGWPMLKDIIIKNFMLYKKIGEPAIYFKRYDADTLVPFSDGKITGGELFKSLYGLDYSLLPIEKVEVLPFPVEGEMALKVV